jgi:hypothetical protein
MSRLPVGSSRISQGYDNRSRILLWILLWVLLWILLWHGMAIALMLGRPLLSTGICPAKFEANLFKVFFPRQCFVFFGVAVAFILT